MLLILSAFSYWQYCNKKLFSQVNLILSFECGCNVPVRIFNGIKFQENVIQRVYILNYVPIEQYDIQEKTMRITENQNVISNVPQIVFPTIYHTERSI